MTLLIENLKIAFPKLLLIFCAVLLLIFLARAIFSFLLYQARKKYIKIKKISQKAIPKNLKKFVKEEEELYRKKEEYLENKGYKILKEEQQHKDIENDMKIVDIVKPIGFFTSMILGQKLTYLIQSAQIINKRNDKGFWVSMIEAQEKAKGRQHGRGR